MIKHTHVIRTRLFALLSCVILGGLVTPIPAHAGIGDFFWYLLGGKNKEQKSEAEVKNDQPVMVDLASDEPVVVTAPGIQLREVREDRDGDRKESAVAVEVAAQFQHLPASFMPRMIGYVGDPKAEVAGAANRALERNQKDDGDSKYDQEAQDLELGQVDLGQVNQASLVSQSQRAPEVAASAGASCHSFGTGVMVTNEGDREDSDDEGEGKHDAARRMAGAKDASSSITVSSSTRPDLPKQPQAQYPVAVRSKFSGQAEQQNQGGETGSSALVALQSVVSRSANMIEKWKQKGFGVAAGIAQSVASGGIAGAMKDVASEVAGAAASAAAEKMVDSERLMSGVENEVRRIGHKAEGVLDNMQRDVTRVTNELVDSGRHELKRLGDGFQMPIQAMVQSVHEFEAAATKELKDLNTGSQRIMDKHMGELTHRAGNILQTEMGKMNTTVGNIAKDEFGRVGVVVQKEIGAAGMHVKREISDLKSSVQVSVDREMRQFGDRAGEVVGAAAQQMATTVGDAAKEELHHMGQVVGDIAEREFGGMGQALKDEGCKQAKKTGHAVRKQVKSVADAAKAEVKAFGEEMQKVGTKAGDAAIVEFGGMRQDAKEILQAQSEKFTDVLVSGVTKMEQHACREVSALTADVKEEVKAMRQENSDALQQQIQATGEHLRGEMSLCRADMKAEAKAMREETGQAVTGALQAEIKATGEHARGELTQLTQQMNVKIDAVTTRLEEEVASGKANLKRYAISCGLMSEDEENQTGEVAPGENGETGIKADAKGLLKTLAEAAAGIKQASEGITKATDKINDPKSLDTLEEKMKNILGQQTEKVSTSFFNKTNGLIAAGTAVCTLLAVYVGQLIWGRLNVGNNGAAGASGLASGMQNLFPGFGGSNVRQAASGGGRRVTLTPDERAQLNKETRFFDTSTSDGAHKKYVLARKIVERRVNAL